MELIGILQNSRRIWKRKRNGLILSVKEHAKEGKMQGTKPEDTAQEHGKNTRS